MLAMKQRLLDLRRQLQSDREFGLTSKTTEHDIEFVGGPFDGYTQLCDLPVTRLPVDVVWFVGNNVYRMLDEQEFESPQPLTSVALYERDLSRGRCRYRFVGAISVKDVLDQVR